MRDLLMQYMESSNDMKRRIESYESEHSEVIDAYKKQGKGALADRQSAANPIIKELNVMRSMYSELQFIIKWLRIGHNPNQYNGIENLQSYTLDHKVLEAVIDSNHYTKVCMDEYSDYTENMNSRVSHALSRLTLNERDVFIMIKCEQLSFAEVAELMNIKKGSVQKYYERAMKKIEDERVSNLFLML